MPQEKIIIKFSAVGDKALTHAIKQLHASQVLLEKGSKEYRKALNQLNIEQKKAIANTSMLGTRNDRLTDKNNKLALSFATLRSQLLLVTFAMGLGGRQIMRFVGEAAKVEAMSTAFDNLSGGAGNAKIALKQLSDAAGGTMSKFNLLQTANNALILGVVKNSEEMNEMFKVAIKLGRAVGRTAKDSVDSLVMGIGRQSRLLLDNIGIIMDAEKAYSDYALQLGVSADSLTDTERRQAFLSATMEAARVKASLLGDDIEIMQSRIEKATAALSDAGVALGEAAIITLDLDTNLDIFSSTLNTLMKPLKDVTNTDLNIVFKTLLRTITFINPQLLILVNQMGFSISEMDLFSESAEDAKKKLIEFKQITQENTQALAKFDEEIANINKEIDKLIEKADEDLLRVMKALRGELLRQQNKELTAEIKRLKEEYRKLNKEINDNNKAQQEAIDNFNELFPTYEAFTGLQMLKLQSDEHELENIRKFIEEYPKEAKALGLVKKELKETTLAGDLAEASIDALANEMARLVMEGENLEKIKPGKIIGQMVLSTIFKKAGAFILGSIFGTPATGVAAAAAVHKGGLIGGDGRIQRFATGGSIRGGDNVPILALGGEFVMSRSAVQSVGIENLNRMNEGGGGSAVTVNVSGNVLSQDFVEGELAENIKEAVRRGTDFGIS